MAALNNLDWNIRWRTRDCEVDGRYGHFHTWEQFSNVVPPSILQGGHSGGVMAQVFGIVEFEDGVERVLPTKIKFIDQEHGELVSTSKYIKEMKEK
jgi:hypothetical protein